MEITEELLKTIRDRVEQVFVAKTKHKPDNIEMYADGSFYVSKTWNISYGGTETIGELIVASDLVADLDEMVRIRKEEEDKEADRQLILEKERKLRFDQIQKNNRKIEYLKLKKEFEGE